MNWYRSAAEACAAPVRPEVRMSLAISETVSCKNFATSSLAPTLFLSCSSVCRHKIDSSVLADKLHETCSVVATLAQQKSWSGMYAVTGIMLWSALHNLLQHFRKPEYYGHVPEDCRLWTLDQDDATSRRQMYAGLHAAGWVRCRNMHLEFVLKGGR